MELDQGHPWPKESAVKGGLHLCLGAWVGSACSCALLRHPGECPHPDTHSEVGNRSARQEDVLPKTEESEKVRKGSDISEKASVERKRMAISHDDRIL